MNCALCDQKSKFRRLIIRDYRYWRVELRDNQTYLGWCFITLKRHLTDLLDITPEEQEELFSVARQLRLALEKSFSPDMFNYASFSNETKHVHLQVVPRYSHQVTFQKITFEDKNWGKNYSPYDKTYQIPESTKTSIIKNIRSNLP